jgi:hypothetical protein
MIGNIAVGSISSAVTPKVSATGGTTGTAGVYKYHFFTGNGTFAVTVGGSVEICGIGGGAGGGYNIASGGGGGEVDIWTALTATASNYDVVVGAGSAGLTGSNGPATQGGITTFKLGATTYVSSLGGGGGSNYTFAGGTGGSGGGGGYEGGAGGTASGSNTFAGGAGFHSGNDYRGAGGGGATAVGLGGAAAYTGGYGGQGYTLTSIDSNLTAANFGTFTGMTVIASGAGGCGMNLTGGGTKGLGGTGAGDGGQSTNVDATSGVSYGSGGGGGKWDSGGQGGAGGNGKAGLVIVRYLA